MSADMLVEIASSLLLTLMIGFLLLVAAALAVEATWQWFVAMVLACILQWRAWRGRDPKDKDHA